MDTEEEAAELDRAGQHLEAENIRKAAEASAAEEDDAAAKSDAELSAAMRVPMCQDG